MSKDSSQWAARSDAAELRQSPALPVTNEGRENGQSVSNLAPGRLSALAGGHMPADTTEAGRLPRRGASWDVLSFGLLLLTSGAVCLERLAWMSGH